MKRYYRKKTVTMVLFFLFLFSFSTLNMVHSLPYFTIDNQADIKDQIAQAQSVINDKVYGKYAFVEAYGYTQKVLGKKEFNAFEVIKDNDGLLHLQTFASGPSDISEVAQNTVSMSTVLEDKGTQFISLIIPDKYVQGKIDYPNGYPYNFVNETLDAYKDVLLENQVSVYDVREGLERTTLTEAELFYISDHHWRIETAFVAYQRFISYLEANYPATWDEDGYYRDPNNYNMITYFNMFLGSLGRKTGSAFVGSDDFTFIYPKFVTDFTMTWSLEDSTFTKSGRFEVTLANPSYLQHQGVFDAKSDTYSMYLDGNAAFTSIHNELVNNDIKVLFIKDSFALPFAAFFANHVEQTDLIDPRYYQGDLATFLANSDYDYVFSALSASSLQSQYIPGLK